MFIRTRWDSPLGVELREIAPKHVELGLPGLNATATGHVSMLECSTEAISDPVVREDAEATARAYGWV